MPGDEGKGSKSKIIPTTSPLYLHQSDSTSLMLTQIIFNGDNYDLWAPTVRNGLDAKNKLAFIEGKAASEVWEELKNRYSAGNAPRVHQLKGDLAECKQGRLSVVEYYTKLKTIWDELANYSKTPNCTCGAAVEIAKEKEEEKVHQFLMGLDNKLYGHVRSNLLMEDPITSLPRAYALVLREERHSSITKEKEESNEPAMAMKSYGAAKGKESYSKKDGRSRITPVLQSLWKDQVSRMEIRRGEHHDGVYKLKSSKVETVRKVSMSKDGELWHKRLGHPSRSKSFSFSELVNYNLNWDSSQFCDSCCRAKQTRNSFSLNNKRCDELFGLIHVDIWGKYPIASLSRAHYFLSIVDDYSRSVWIYLMKEKSEASKFMKIFCKMVKTQFNKLVKIIQSDNGSELLSGKMKNYYENNGILFQTSNVDTSQQNGRVERKHRHILEKARALRFSGHLPIQF
ncbi:uncharacterized protein LOC141642178 [Silene latifolia]|uniref:uncharacterized protein LOC141642178 n=1 Tax=Silene latifolia TaxID=37657 RepID=UPI003D7884FE